MGKCCGVLATCSVITVMLIATGSYFIYSYIVTSGVDLITTTMTSSVNELATLAFDEQDAAEINLAVENLAQAMRSGDVGLLDMFSEASEELEAGLMSHLTLLAFQKQYLQNLQLDEIASEPVEIFNTFMAGVINGEISESHLNQIVNNLTVMVEAKSETEENGSKSTFTYSYDTLDKEMSQDTIKQILTKMKQVADENNLQQPGEHFNLSYILKNEIVGKLNALSKVGD